MLNLLASDMSYSDSLYVFLLGFAVVFGGIVIIILCIYAESVIFKAIKNKKENKTVVDNSVAETDRQNLAVENNEISDEVKAAIIAAITAYYYEDKPKCEFKVKKIKKIG